MGGSTFCLLLFPKLIGMKSNTEGNINQHLDETFQIYYLAKENFEIVHFFESEQFKIEFPLTLRSYGMLSFTKHMHWRVAIIELNKLTSHKENEHFRLDKLFNKLESEIRRIKKQRIKAWRQLLADQRHVIGRIKDERDTRFAHQDKKVSLVIEENLRPQDLLPVFSALETILKQIFEELRNEIIDFQPVLNSPVKNLREKILPVLEHHRYKLLKPLFDDAEEHQLESEIPKRYRKD